MMMEQAVQQPEPFRYEFQGDPTEHVSLSNVLGPNPWNVGFILNGRLPEQVIQLLKAFLRSVAMRFPKSYSLEEAMKPAAVRGKLRQGKLCLESVGSWSQISLIHVAAFCHYERLEEDIHLILRLKGNINARALFDVELDFPSDDLIIKERVFCSVLPIHFAVYAGNVHGVKVLLRCRAAVESRATFDSVPDYTPLHLATTLWARAGDDAVIQHQVVKVLLESMADPTTVDLSGVTCNDLRPQGSCTLKTLRARKIGGMKKGMVVELDLEAIVRKGPKARLEVRQFLAETADARRCEFVVMADAEDPDEEDDLLQISQLTRDNSEESRPLKIQQSCVSVLGYRFFQYCLRYVLNEICGTPRVQSPRSMVDSPLIRSRTLDDESAVEGSLTIQDFRVGGPSKRRAVTIADLHSSEDMMSEVELEPGIVPEVELEDAVQMKLSNPLRPGKFYRKRNRVSAGYLLHYAVDEMVREEDKKWQTPPEDVLQYIVASRADIHAKAEVERRTNANEFCSVTSMHLAAVGHCLPAVKALLNLGASLESASVFDKIPCWTPLADAIVATIDYNHAMRSSASPYPLIRGAKDSVIQYLLEQRANPDGCGGSGGLSCLHLAVGKNCDTELICLLVENSADVTLKTSAYVRATRAHGNRGWDRGLTPLQICDYADQVYSQKQRSEVMALLAPSLRGASFLLQDVTSMAAFSVSGAQELVKRVVEESNKDSGGTAARALSTLRLRAVTGARSAEGLEPVDSIAELLEIAPSIAISVLDDLLLTEPDTEDPHVHPLPHRANMNYKHRAQGFGWSATVFDLPNLSVQTSYQPDTNEDRQTSDLYCHSSAFARHKAWPCWLRSHQCWHGTLAPKASCNRANLMDPMGIQKVVDQMGAPTALKGRHQDGDRDVCIKVLLLSNVLDVRIMMALTSVSWSEIFAEKVVQAILSCGYESFCFRPITASLLQELMLFCAFLSWSFGFWLWEPRKTAWTVIFAILVNETITIVWWMRGHFCYGWTLKQFFLHPMAGFRIIQLYLLWWLLWRTFFGYDLDHTWRNDEDLQGNKRTFERSLLGANMLLQCFLFIFLAKGASPRLEFGRHLLAILHSFLRLGVIFTVLILVFASFTSAYIVMGSKLPLRALIEKVYRGLFLADGEGLDVMEGELHDGELQPNNLDTYLTLFSTFIVTICLLNVSIAVFTMEYEAAIKESWLHFWRWRARLCAEVLLCPRWPWKFEAKWALCSERRRMAQCLEWAAQKLKEDVMPLIHGSRLYQRTFNLCGYRVNWEPLTEADLEPKDEDADYVKIVGWLTAVGLALLGCILFCAWFLHAAFPGLAFGLALTVLKSMCARGPFGLATAGQEACCEDEDEEEHSRHSTDRAHFLWICYRADYDANVFMNKEVHKEHLDQLESRLHTVSQNVEKWGEEVTNITQILGVLNDSVKRLEARLICTPQAAATPMSAVPDPSGLFRASSVPHATRRPSYFRRMGSLPSSHGGDSTSMDTSFRPSSAGQT
ncbi:unnamed protein product [Symbiodinium natans]|uniref:Uncharacterized protein n=1 Tax=Symbiodinium natans TaxID=878477 RepID=A0A812NXX5_9DINO|nr:unnamed protein product [Symbiodinium natans]